MVLVYPVVTHLCCPYQFLWSQLKKCGHSWKRRTMRVVCPFLFLCFFNNFFFLKVLLYSLQSKFPMLVILRFLLYLKCFSLVLWFNFFKIVNVLSHLSQQKINISSWMNFTWKSKLPFVVNTEVHYLQLYFFLTFVCLFL